MRRNGSDPSFIDISGIESLIWTHFRNIPLPQGKHVCSSSDEDLSKLAVVLLIRLSQPC